MKRIAAPLACLCLLACLAMPAAGAGPAQGAAALSVLDRAKAPVARIRDGDTLTLRAQAPANVPAPTRVTFRLDGDDAAVGECTIAQGASACQTEPVRAYGWFWGKDGTPRAARQLGAASGDRSIAPAVPLSVASRPVVMVHGFIASWEAWANYLGDSGYLARIGVPGFAVGDGRAPGVLNTGSIVNPVGRTNSLDENARILGGYIAAVKQQTGAQQVDLIAHSMGGLIARYYLDRVMQERDVAQLLMLGSPNLGTDCAVLPSALNFYLPAALEIRGSYVREIFNRQITHRKGVPFFMGAGVPFNDPIQAPCTSVPHDIVVSRESVRGVQGTAVDLPDVHLDLNTSQEVFDAVVKPFVQRPPGQFAEAADLTPPAESPDALQFTNLHAGHLAPGQTQDHTINLDNVAVASFALFDPSRSLTVTVRGATGNVITLDARANGLVVVDDPASLVHLGYGFNNPRPGPWQITLATTARTPPGGADYAITAQLRGGAVLKARTSELLPPQGTPLRLSARLEGVSPPPAIRSASAHIRTPGGRDETVVLAAGAAGEWGAAYTPRETGLHAVDIAVSGTGADNVAIERTTFLSFEAQPPADSVAPYVSLALLVACLLGFAAGALALFRRIRRPRQPGGASPALPR